VRRYIDEPSRSTREVGSEAMSEFRGDGLIETRKRKTFILDRENFSQHASAPSGSSADGQIRV
jgi:hypothetical protein